MTISDGKIEFKSIYNPFQKGNKISQEVFLQMDSTTIFVLFFRNIEINVYM